MKCWLGHTRMEGLSGETKVHREQMRFYGHIINGDNYSHQSHICKHCGTHFSTLIKLDQHTLDVTTPKETIRIGDGLPSPRWRKAKAGKRK